MLTRKFTTVCALPIFCFTHVAHAAFLLVTIEKAIETLDSTKLEPALVEDLKCRSYRPNLDGVVTLLQDAAKHSPSRCVTSFLKLLTALRDWMRQQSSSSKSSVQAWVEGVAKDRITTPLKDPDLGTALELVLAEGDVDMSYFEGLLELLERPT